MWIKSDTLGAHALLLALDGEPVGHVREAYVASKERGGFVVQGALPVVLPPPEVAKAEGVIEWTRREGRVDVLGTIDDPPEMIAARLQSIRLQLGKPAYADLLGKERSPETDAECGARVLEHLAWRLRRGEVDQVSATQSRRHDNLPVSAEERINVLTGEMSLFVRCVDREALAAYERTKAEWAKAHPDLVPEYVRSRREG